MLNLMRHKIGLVQENVEYIMLLKLSYLDYIIGILGVECC